MTNFCAGNYDVWMSKKIVKALKAYNKHRDGARPTSATEEEWKYITDKMIYAFEADPEESPWNEYADDFLDTIEMVNVGELAVNIKCDEDLREKFDRRAAAIRAECDEGRKLFAEWFHAIWI